MLTAEERTLRSRIAAHEMHARNDPRAITEAARRAYLSHFEHLADPDGSLPPAERRRRAEHLRRAHMARLSLQAVRARRARREEAPDDAA